MKKADQKQTTFCKKEDQIQNFLLVKRYEQDLDCDTYQPRNHHILWTHTRSERAKLALLSTMVGEDFEIPRCEIAKNRHRDKISRRRKKIM